MQMLQAPELSEEGIQKPVAGVDKVSCLALPPNRQAAKPLIRWRFHRSSVEDAVAISAPVP